MGQAEGGSQPDEANGGAGERSRQARQQGIAIAGRYGGLTAIPPILSWRLETDAQSRLGGQKGPFDRTRPGISDDDENGCRERSVCNFLPIAIQRRTCSA